jgi:replicative DNA helicase
MDNIYHIADVIRTHKETIYGRNGQPQEFKITSLPNISNKIWGFKRQKFIVIGARPGNGKSMLMLQLAYDFAAQEKVVYFFSFEMSLGVCAERIISTQCRIDNFTLTNGKVADFPTQRRDIDNLMDRLDKMHFVIFESVGQNLPQLNRIMTMIQTKPDVIFIDYGNLVLDVMGRTKKEVFDEYIKGLRALAVREKICVVMGAQINRSVAQKDGKIREPILEDLKDSGENEQTADMVLLLHYPFNSTGNEDDRGKFYIRIAKNRDGRTGRIRCKITPEHYLIEEDIEETDGQRTGNI